MKYQSIFTAILLGGISLGQTQKLTMQDAVLGLGSNLRVDNLSQLKWIPNQNTLTESVKTSYGNALVSRAVPSLKTDTIMRSTDLAQYKLKSVPNLNWINADEAFFQNGSTIYLWTKSTNKTQGYFTLPEQSSNVEFNLKYKTIAYVLDNNLFYIDEQKKVHVITSDGSQDIVNGKSVHRDEFGIHKGIFISPKGNAIAFYRMDQSMVEDYPIIDWSSVPAVNHNIKYPFAGRNSHQVTLGIYHPQTQQKIFLQTGEPKDQYLTSVTWNPDGQSIYVGLLNRDQNHLKLNQYDVKTGQLIKTLFEESHDKYVEPQNELYFLPNGKEFVWWSQRDGFMHLYRYDLSGKLLNPITKGDWLVNEIVGQNTKNQQLLITATKDGAMEKHLYVVKWQNGKINRIDIESGYHNFTVNDLGTYAIDNWSNESTPRKIDVISIDKKFKKNLLNAKNPLASFQMPKVENITLKADDGTDLYGKLILPTDFDSTQKYPVIVYLYNGPHAQMNLNRFPASGNLWYDYMAQNGYVVWVMDGRGSANRGLKFEQAIFRNLGQVEMQDQLQGINYLKSLPYVDANRMGIHGWSYGGFMTTSFMLHQPDLFKAGVAGGPVMDWSMYEIMYGERYMDSPTNNPEGYAKTKLIDKTKNLKGKLLLIHGTDDDVVVLQHSIDFLRNSVTEGVQVDFFVYPGYEHNVRGKDRVHLMQKITDYFDLYLKQ